MRTVWRDQVKHVRALRLGRAAEREANYIWPALPRGCQEELLKFVIGLEGEELHRMTIVHELVARAKRLFVPEKVELVERLCVQLGYVNAADVNKLGQGPRQVDRDPLELFCWSPVLPGGMTRYEAMFASEIVPDNRFLMLFFTSQLSNGIGRAQVRERG